MTTIVYGIASTPKIDKQRHSVVRGAFDLTKPPPLLWRHRVGMVAGTTTKLWYEGDNLMVRAVVPDDEKAEQAHGFSVAFGVIKYSIAHKGTPRYFARVSKARLDEISLVMNPANPACVITHREKREPCAAVEMLDAAKSAILNIQHQLEIIGRKQA